jgi:hypothetical protein
MIAICYGFFLITDLVLEGLWMRTGIWAYPGGGTLLTLFDGSRYQFPIKEMFLWGGAWAAFTCLRYFRNDKGETFAERGANQLKTGPKRKLALQFLALYGAINLLYVLTYNLPINILNMHDTTWSQGVQEVTYMNDNLCGPGTGHRGHSIRSSTDSASCSDSRCWSPASRWRRQRSSASAAAPAAIRSVSRWCARWASFICSRVAASRPCAARNWSAWAWMIRLTTEVSES